MLSSVIFFHDAVAKVYRLIVRYIVFLYILLLTVLSFCCPSACVLSGYLGL
jgi:hypothetical protein